MKIKTKKPIIGSTLSPQFRKILLSLEMRGISRFQNIKDFDPSDVNASGPTFRLFDGKPGVFYYNEMFFAFLYASTLNKTEDDETIKYCNQIKACMCYLEDDSMKVINHSIESLTYFNGWNSKTAKACSDYARSVMSQCQHETVGWGRFLSHFVDAHKKVIGTKLFKMS